MNVCKIMLLIFLLVSACTPSKEEQATPAAIAMSATTASTDTPEVTPTSTHTAMPPTLTFTPTVVLPPTITTTPTFAFPTVTVNKQAHCRYGPSVAYLHAA